MIQLLLNCRVSIGAADLAGGTPLHWAAARLLLDYAADLTDIHSNGLTPLEVAQEHGFQDVVWLLKHAMRAKGRKLEDVSQ